MMMDYRELLLPLCARKEDFKDMPEPEYLTSKQIRALEDIFDAGLIKEVRRNTSAYNKIFNSDPDFDITSATDQEIEDFYQVFPRDPPLPKGRGFSVDANYF